MKARAYPTAWDAVAPPTPRSRNHSHEWKQTKARYRKRREALIAKLGGRCTACGSREDLHFDHPNGRTWNVRAVNQMIRLRRYEREAERGELQLLCSSCNGYDGAVRKRFHAAIRS